MYYRKMGLRAVVRNVPEYRQSDVVNTLIDRFRQLKPGESFAVKYANNGDIYTTKS